MKIQIHSQIHGPNLTIHICPHCLTLFSGRAVWAERWMVRLGQWICGCKFRFLFSKVSGSSSPIDRKISMGVAGPIADVVGQFTYSHSF